nr:MAG TPA: hypothetical protein [Caudoviricetes sp.]
MLEKSRNGSSFFTCSVTLTGLFYFFGNSEDSLGRCGSVYIPPPGSVPGNADRVALCPMDSRCSDLNAVIRSACGSDQGILLAVLLSYCTKNRCYANVYLEYTLKEH